MSRLFRRSVPDLDDEVARLRAQYREYCVARAALLRLQHQCEALELSLRRLRRARRDRRELRIFALADPLLAAQSSRDHGLLLGARELSRRLVRAREEQTLRRQDLQRLSSCPAQLLAALEELGALCLEVPGQAHRVEEIFAEIEALRNSSASVSRP